jgi:predicted metal-dependent phosphoesterase TrpH
VSATPQTGRADLHIHTLASDGVDGVEAILRDAEERAGLDVIAVTDHERIDAALVARSMARQLGLSVEVVVGEEITTRGGHLLGLFLERPVRPLLSLRESVLRVHDQGGLAIVAHPLVPFPLCASARAILRLADDADPAARPDAIETFNPTSAGRPWHGRVVRFAAENGFSAVGDSDAHTADAIGRGFTTFPGATAHQLRAAILDGTTAAHGEFYPFGSQFSMFGRQLRKYARDIRDETLGRVLRPGTGRDLGYPGGRARPPRFEGRVEP